MNRDQKIKALKMLLAGKPVKDAFSVISVALLPVKETRPDLLVFVCGNTDYELKREISKLFPKTVKPGRERIFEDNLKQQYPDNRIDVHYGITEDEFDSIREQLELKY